MRMTTIKKTGLCVALALGMSLTANAIELIPGDEIATSNETKNLKVSEIEDLVGTDCDLISAYKSNVGGEEEGGFADDYSTEYSPSADPEDATISWDGPDSISGAEIYLLVKDGNSTPAQYLFDISTWNGQDDIQLTGFWSGESGSISHIEILYCEGTSVPDGGASVLLLGIGLLGLGAVGLRKKQ